MILKQHQSMVKASLEAAVSLQNITDQKNQMIKMDSYVSS